MENSHTTVKMQKDWSLYLTRLMELAVSQSIQSLHTAKERGKLMYKLKWWDGCRSGSWQQRHLMAVMGCRQRKRCIEVNSWLNLLSKTHSRTCRRTFLCGELSTKVLILCGVLSVESVLNFWKQASERHRDRETTGWHFQVRSNVYFSLPSGVWMQGIQTNLFWILLIQPGE